MKMMNGNMQKEKTAKRKVIKGVTHACVWGPSLDVRYEKCYQCPNIRLLKK